MASHCAEPMGGRADTHVEPVAGAPSEPSAVLTSAPIMAKGFADEVNHATTAPPGVAARVGRGLGRRGVEELAERVGRRQLDAMERGFARREAVELGQHLVAALDTPHLDALGEAGPSLGVAGELRTSMPSTTTAPTPAGGLRRRRAEDGRRRRRGGAAAAVAAAAVAAAGRGGGCGTAGAPGGMARSSIRKTAAATTISHLAGVLVLVVSLRHGGGARPLPLLLAHAHPRQTEGGPPFGLRSGTSRRKARRRPRPLRT